MKTLQLVFLIGIFIFSFGANSQVQDDSDWVRFPPRKKIITSKNTDVITNSFSTENNITGNKVLNENDNNSRPIPQAAINGPQINTLVAIDESKYDLLNKEKIETTDVLNRLTKETYLREIFRVREIPEEVKSIFIVNESLQIQTYKDIEQFVLVNRIENNSPWTYQMPLKISNKK